MFSPRGELIASIIIGALLLAWFVLVELVGLTVLEPLCWVSLGVGLVYGARASAGALRGGVINIDVLMVVAALLAAWVGHPDEGALLLFLFVLSGSLESLAMERTKREVRALHALAPTEATVLRDNQWKICAPSDLRIGERIRISAGAVIPVDARVAQGRTSVDQASLTGESLPRTVQVGDEIFAGTVNVGNPIEASVLREERESSLQHVLDLVTRAQAQREPIQRVIDRVSQPYAIGVFVATALIFTIWVGMLDKTTEHAAYVAVTFLIVASPCALIIATPTATLAAISRAAREGVLFKGGQAIERLARMRAVCLDKTGTLTQGRPALESVEILAGNAESSWILAAARALEAGSTHPVAVAITRAADAAGVPTLSADELTADAGLGVAGVIDGRRVRVGSVSFVREIAPRDLADRIQQRMNDLHESGRIGAAMVWTEPDGGVSSAALLAMSDPIRDAAPDFIAQLHDLGIKPVRMLTGDEPAAAKRIAEILGLDAWNARLRPDDKVRIVRETKDAMRRGDQASTSIGTPRFGVGFIGDGVNDAPALAAADVSIAIGTIGSDAAMESADIVLLHDDLRRVPWALSLARRCRAIVVANLTLALTVIVVMAAATLIGSLLDRPVPLGIGVLAHEGGTVLVVANSLRLLLVRPGSRRHKHASHDSSRD